MLEKMRINKIYKVLLITLLSALFLLLVSMQWIHISTKNNIFDNIKKIPYNKVGLIPGCNKYIANGVINVYYEQRIAAGVELFRNSKIDYILVSGDNAHPSYDEPREMRNSLVEAGIPNDRIISDYAGFRTLDTIIRAKEVFSLKDFTLISQSFQNRRGIFIGKFNNLNIVAYNADFNDKKFDISIETRELFAKINMLLDLYIFAKEPKFLGETIPIGNDQ
ncbi:MAG: YdcF family protein [Spirochaetales bacterium]|nr:YdcF family protein [Spirochaetales bacterium]